MMRRLLQLLLLWCLAATAAGQGAPLVLGDEGHYNLANHVQVLEDRDGQLTVDDMDDPAFAARFRPMRNSGPSANLGMSRSAIWLRIALQVPRHDDPHWLLELAYPPLDRIELYVPGIAGGWERQVGGDTEPFTRRPVAHRHHVFPVTLLSERPTVIYLRLSSNGVIAAPLRLWRPQALWQSDQVSYALMSLYFGVLLGLLAYNLLLFVSVRDTAYLLYVLFVACMGVGQAALTGLGAQFLWPQQVWWNGVAINAALGLAGVFGLLFARRFLESMRGNPRVDRALLALAAFWAATVPVTLGAPYLLATWMLMVLSPVSVAALVVSGVAALRRGQTGARHYLTAWAVLLVSVLVLFLHNAGLLPSNGFTANSLLIGSALEMVLLSFALAARINAARRFREQAQARIAAERAMVEVLSQSKERLRAVLEERETILDSSIVGICFLTAEGRLRWANRAMLEMFGARSGEVDSMEVFYPSREAYLQVGREVVAAVARGEVYERELQVQRLDGTRLWILLSGRAVSPTDLAQGTVWGIMDITRRKELEQQLQRTMAEREAILNNAVVGIVLSVRRRHEWVNAKFADMLGYPPQALIGQTSDYIHPDRAAWERFGVEARAALVATDRYTCEMQLRRRDGDVFWVEMGGSCVRPHDPDSGVIWTFLDITLRKASEAEMREALEQQKALNVLRSRFVAMTSHEFRTPLAAILSAEELLRHYGDRLPAQEKRETLDSIAAGVQRMSRMLDRVLLLGRADAKMLECQPATVDLRALCPQLVEEARLQHPEGKAAIACEIASEIGPGRYDEKLLRHIFVNLLANAIKYSPEGGRVLFEARAEGGATVFRVSDQGIGIPPEELGDLFESFHRASNVGAIQGTGLGLAIVKSAVDVHGGAIHVESRLGVGTTFVVRIAPAAEMQALRPALPEPDRALPS